MCRPNPIKRSPAQPSILQLTRTSPLHILQDTSDFNIATSSLHALSTSAGSQSSTEKHSPHTSPRLGRRSTTPSLMAVQNDLYAGGAPVLSLPSCSSGGGSSGSGGGGGGATSANSTQQPQPSAPPAAAVISNGGGGVGGGGGSAGTSAAGGTSCSSSSSQKTTNRMSAPLIGSSVINSTYGQKMCSSKVDNGGGETASISSYAILQNLQDAGGTGGSSSGSGSSSASSSNSTSAAAAPNAVAPPLPPRKSPGVETPVKPTAAATPSSSKSIDNIQCSLDNVPPQTTAPPIPPHVSSSVDTLAEDLMRQQRIASSTTSPVLSLLDEAVEVGPAETISGVIDTRPLEARGTLPKPSSSTQDSPSSHYTQLCTTTTSAAALAAAAALANGQKKTTPNLANPVELQPQRHQPLLYANVTINQKDCGTVPYENINLEYIARLMNAGYSKENAITALGISRNNIEMAGDILREFVSKNSA